MKNFQLLVLVSFALFSTTTNPVSALWKGDWDNSWDFLLLVSRYAGTVGYGQQLPSNISDFTLHGIWPTRDDGSYPSFCNDSQPFSPSPINSLVGNLWVYWYDYQGDGFEFWSHEWDKHGTCAESLTSLDNEFNYFSEALNLMENFNVMNALQSAGITPSNSQTYTETQIVTAVYNTFGVKPLLSCTNVTGGIGLDYVQFCITKSLTSEPCPTGNDDSCNGAQILLPPITYSD